MNREDIMTDNNAASDKEKVVTKYDRKMQKRKEEARKEAKRRFITKWVCIAVLAGVILGSGTAIGLKLNSIYNDYIEVDNDKISQIEFDFYYGIAKTNSLNTTLYGSMTYGDYYTSYMGYKTSQSDKSQEYSTDYTWYDFFANSAVSTIKETKALLKDADANGFTYDNEHADYDEFIGKLKDVANKADTSYSDYLKQMFGKRATEKRVKEFLKDYLKSTALFGFIDKETNLRRYKESMFYVARKNGKSTMLSGIAAYMMIADNEAGAEIYSCATKKDQAKLVFDETLNMINQSPYLSKHIKKRKSDLYFPLTMSKFQPLGKNSDTSAGI